MKTREVLARIAQVPKSVAAAYADPEDHAFLLVSLANWVDAGREKTKIFESSDDALRAVISLAGNHFAPLLQERGDWKHPKMQAEAQLHPLLNEDELCLLRETSDLLQAMDRLMDKRSPRWLIGWRRNARSNDERTTISSIMCRSGVGDSIFLLFPSSSPKNVAALVSMLNSLVFDFVARQKIGGVNYSFYYMKQLPVLKPDQLSHIDLSFIVPRTLELTYTTIDLKPWAIELGYTGEPFPFDPVRRAVLRAELDAYYARLYGLTRDELRYILDPADIMGPDYPSETFRVLKNNEEKAFGEYRTRRLVLAAWDVLEGGKI